MAFLENIGQEIKKIPPWGYALIAAGAFVAYQFWQSQQNASGNTASADTTGITGQTATGIDTGFNSADFGGNGDTSGGSSAGTTGTSSGSTGTSSGSSGTSGSSGGTTGTTSTSTGSSGAPPAQPTAQPTQPTTPKPTQPATVHYTVKSGDTLADIAYYFRTSRGMNVSWEQIYSANEQLIEQTARNHGFSSSDDGHWIFPGEVLTIP